MTILCCGWNLRKAEECCFHSNVKPREDRIWAGFGTPPRKMMKQSKAGPGGPEQFTRDRDIDPANFVCTDEDRSAFLITTILKQRLLPPLAQPGLLLAAWSY